MNKKSFNDVEQNKNYQTLPRGWKSKNTRNVELDEKRITNNKCKYLILILVCNHLFQIKMIAAAKVSIYKSQECARYSQYKHFLEANQTPFW